MGRLSLNYRDPFSMYAFLRGVLIEANPSAIVLDVGGVGYFISVPISYFGKLEVGKQLLLHTSFVIRELSQALYGFLEKEERDLFEILISLSGVGPKTALGIIGHLPLEDLEDAIRSQNLSLLAKVPGVGKKTAERLCVELRDKLQGIPKKAKKESLFSGKIQDAFQALLHLGYTQSVAEEAVMAASRQLPEEVELSTLITYALRLQRDNK